MVTLMYCVLLVSSDSQPKEMSQAEGLKLVQEFAQRIPRSPGRLLSAEIDDSTVRKDYKEWRFFFTSSNADRFGRFNEDREVGVDWQLREVVNFREYFASRLSMNRTDLVKPEELERADLARRIAECQRKASRMVLPRLGLWPTKPVTMRGGEKFDYPIPSIVVPYRFQFKGVPLIDVMDGARFTFALENGELYDYTMTRRAKVTLATAKIEKDEARETAIAHYRKGREKNPTREYAAPVSRPTGRLAYVVPAALFGYEPKFLPWEPEAQLGYAFRFGEVHLYVSAVTGKVIGGRAADLDLR